MTDTAEIYQFPRREAKQTFEAYWEECQEVGAYLSKPEAYRLFHMAPEQYFANAGWVYVLGNELMAEGVYKVGRTTGTIQRRMRQLYTTGVPAQFDCLHAHWFADCITAEMHVHALLSGYRVNDSREFFAADLKTICHALLHCSVLGEMHPDHMLELAQARHEYAIKHERVNGVLVVQEKRLPDDMEVPF